MRLLVWLMIDPFRATARQCQGEKSGRDQRRRHQNHSAGEAVRRLLHHPDYVQTGEAAKVSERVDKRDRARGRGAGEKIGWHRPERAKGSPDSRRGNRERSQ